MAKKILFLMIAAAVSCLSAVPLKSDMDPKLPRRISIGRPGKFVLDKNVCVVLPPGSTPTAKFGAAELAKFLGRAFNAKISIVSKPVPGKFSIVVGDRIYAKTLGIDTSKFDRDGFAIKSGKNMIVIAGRDAGKGYDPAKLLGIYFEHATAFGVYDFLERFVGVRFYFPGRYGEVVPRAEKILLGDIDIYDRPDHFQRRTQESYQNWYDKSNNRKGVMLQNYRRRAQTFYVPCCHSLEHSGYYRRFAKTHPEYFAKDPNGKLYAPTHWSVGSACYLSKGFRNEVCLDGISYLKGEPPAKRGILGGTDRHPREGFRWPVVVGQPGFFSVMPGDHHRRCLCKKCKTYMDKHGANEYVWDLVADIARRIQRSGVKGKVTGMAYASYTEPPKQKLPSNLEVMVAVSGPWADQFPALRKQHDERIRAWTKKLGKKVWLWTYPHKQGYGAAFYHVGIPQMAPRTIGKYYKRQAPYTFGSFYEGESDQWIFNYLNTYVYFKQAWDNNADIDALVDEHHKMMFGKAAAEMNIFYRELENTWTKKLLGKVVETELGPVTTPPTLHEVWEKIYSPAKLKYFGELFDRAERKVSGETLGRLKFIRKHFLDPLLKESAKYFREKNALADWSYYMKPLASGENITIDGSLNDSGWKKAEKTFLLPTVGDTCEVKTIVRGRADAKNLYFSFECMEPRMNDIQAERMIRNHKDLWMDSVAELFLNPSGNAKDYYHFIVNSKGVFSARKRLRAGRQTRQDPKWSSKARFAAKTQKDRFIIEAVIPKAELTDFDPEKFRANFCRHRSLKRSKVTNRFYVWSPNRIGFHEVENYGRLTFKAPADGNMIKNGNFTRPLYRTWLATKGVSFDENTFITGGRSIKLDARDGGFKWLFHGLPLKSNTTYAVSFYMKTKDLQATRSGGGLRLLLGDNKNNFFPKHAYTGTMPWTRQGFFWTTGPDGGKVIKGCSRCIRFEVRNAKGIVWLDNIKFAEVPAK